MLAISMLLTLTPILASDMTGALFLPALIFLWTDLGGGVLAGLLALALYRSKRVAPVWGLMLGTFSMVAGAGGLLSLVVFTRGAVVWAGALTSLALGISSIMLWKRRTH